MLTVTDTDWFVSCFDVQVEAGKVWASITGGSSQDLREYFLAAFEKGYRLGLEEGRVLDGETKLL